LLLRVVAKFAFCCRTSYFPHLFYFTQSYGENGRFGCEGWASSRQAAEYSAKENKTSYQNRLSGQTK